MRSAKKTLSAGAVCTLALLLGPAAAHAGEKQFGYVYEPLTLEPGAVELEQWVTPRLGKASGIYSGLDMRTEIELGVVEDLQTSLYLNYNSLRVADARPGRRGVVDLLDKDGKTRFSELTFDGVSNEWVYKFTDPVADALGLAAYLEWKTNGQELEIEEKLIVAKTWGAVTLAMNMAVEEDWRWKSDEAPRELRCEADVGLAYRIPGTPVGLGLEFRTVHNLERWGDYKHSVFSLGPNVHVATKRWWATLTLMPQIASQTPSYRWFDYDGYEAFEGRLIVGVEF